MLKVSVIIPAYNYGRYVGAAIDSALSQTAAGLEVIVVDDGSTDDTPAVLERYGKEIRVVRKQNKGLSAARNSGVAIARGDLLAFLDADDVWLPRKIELQLNHLAAEPGLGLVHCGVQDIDASGALLEEHLDGLAGWVGKDMLMFRRSVILAAGSGAMVTREAYEAIGGFDTRLRHSEDWDFCYRLACRYRVGFVPKVLVQYRRHGTNMSLNVREMERALLFLTERVFENAGPELQPLRRRSCGNLHAMLAGSYLKAGSYGRFGLHACRSVLITPDNLLWFLGFPARRWRRRRSLGRGPSTDRQVHAGTG